jgi:hypothetical protein
MASTKKILTSIHGRRCGLSADGKLVVDGRVALTMDDLGAFAAVQPPPNAVNTTAGLTVAQLQNGLITSTTAAAVAGTLPTGTVGDTAGTGLGLAVNEGIYWSVVNTGATNAFTVTAAAGHTIVGNAIVALSASGRFMTVKTAANTFVTYRIA